ncbi:unnamed protein product [Caenorhabditis brenneri]
MSDKSTDSTKKSTEQPNNGLVEAMGQLSVNSDETSTPRKNLSDMPIDVVALIIERSDYKEQIILRKVSKSFRALVDKHKPALARLKIYCKYDLIICNYNDHCVAYVSPGWSSSESPYYVEYIDTIITNDDYEQVAFDDLALNLKNPKLKLKGFSFDSEENNVVYDDSGSFDSEFHDKFKTMKNILKSRNHQLSVKTCAINISNPRNAMSILPYLKPGVLEKITILHDGHGPGWKYSVETMQQVSLLDQWKQAEHLELRSGFAEFLVQHVTHFKRFEIYERILTLDRLLEIRNCILEHENPEFCLIRYRFYDFGAFDIPDLSHYTIPDSEYYVEVKHDHYHVMIKKKKK